jgi:hypothetical protein
VQGDLEVSPSGAAVDERLEKETGLTISWAKSVGDSVLAYRQSGAANLPGGSVTSSENGVLRLAVPGVRA